MNDLNKLWLIVKREYLIRVRKTTFILATLLMPLGIAFIAFISVYLASSSMSGQKKIVLVDKSDLLEAIELTTSQYLYTKSSESISDLKDDYFNQGYDLLIEVPELDDLKAQKHTVNFYSLEKLSLISLEQIERSLSRGLKRYKVSQSDVDQETLDELEIRVTLENAISYGEDGSASNKSSRMSIIISSALSYVMGFLMYLVIFIYGSMVMRSVMEENVHLFALAQQCVLF